MRFIRCLPSAAFLAALAVIGLHTTACSQAPRDAGVEAVHGQVVAAVQARDAGAIFDVSVPELSARMETLFARWVRARDGLEVGQDADRSSLREGLALRHLEGVRTPREFFIALVDFHGVTLEGGVDAGLSPESVRLDGDRALLRTRSGEAFGYRKHAGEWRSELASDALRMWPDIGRLEENLARVERHLSATP